MFPEETRGLSPCSHVPPVFPDLNCRVLASRGHSFFRMPRNARCIIPEMAYHVTQRGTNHQRVFFSASDRAAYLRLLQQNLGPAETRVLAWCLMNNHVHLVLVPGREDSLEILLRRLHGRYAQMVNARRLRSGHLWQNRFFFFLPAFGEPSAALRRRVSAGFERRGQPE